MSDVELDLFIERLCGSSDDEIESLVEQFIIRHTNQRVVDSPRVARAFNRKLRVRVFNALAEMRESNDKEVGSHNGDGV